MLNDVKGVPGHEAAQVARARDKARLAVQRVRHHGRQILSLLLGLVARVCDARCASLRLREIAPHVMRLLGVHVIVRGVRSELKVTATSTRDRVV